MKKLVKVSIGTTTGIGALTAVAVPLTLMATQQVIENKMKEVNFNGKTFTNRASLLKYISANSEQLKVAPDLSLYNVQIGNDSVEFSTYSKAMTFIQDKTTSKEVYIKPGVLKNSLDTIGPDSFLEAAKTRKYVVFEKYDRRLDNSDKVGGKLEHSYTAALLPIETDSDATRKRLEAKVNEARLEAAKSYIKVHTSFYFNGIYFKSINDLRKYLEANKGDNFSQIVTKSNLAVIDTTKGTLKFEKGKDLTKDFAFRSKIQNLATPFYNTGSKLNPQWVEINQSNISNIAMSIDPSSLDYINVNSNESMVTQIVDMDSSTPSGTFSGNYFIKSALSADGVKDLSNWEKTQNKQMNVSELNDIAILKSIVSYALTSKDIGSILELMDITKVDANHSETFIDFLSKDKFNIGNKNYLKDTVDLVKSLAKGVRHNFLDTLIATHSFVINKMVKNNEDVKDIITVAKFFDSMAKIIDSFLAPLIAPFLVNNKSSSNFKVDYISSAFGFYDETKPGKGISFQDNPIMYYRKLTGHKEEGEQDSSSRRKSILAMLKAAMGLNSIMLSGLRHNQVVFDKWENQTIKKIKNSKYYTKTNGNYPQNNSNYPQNNLNYPRETINELSFSYSKTKSRLWDFSLSGLSGAEHKSKEFISIWNNLNKLPFDFQVDSNTFISRDKIKENYNNYVVNFQNNVIKIYKNKINKKMSRVVDVYTDPNTGFIKEGMDPDPYDFNTNLFSYIPLSKERLTVLKQGIDIPTSYDGYKHLNEMITSAVKPFKDRAKEFVINVGSFVAEAGIAVATAGASAETMLAKEALAKPAKKSSNWATQGKSAKFKSKINKIKSEKEIRSKLIEDLDKSFKSHTFGFDSDSPATKTLKTLLMGPIGNLLFQSASPDIQKMMNDVMDVMVGIAKNVVPFLSSLMGIVDSFSKTETQTYGYLKSPENTKFYWNGGRVDYSWWGLGANQVYSLNDLKVLVSPDIISGYKFSGVYYKNKLYPDLAKLKMEKANEIVRNISINDTDPKIGWALPLRGQTPSMATKYQGANKVIEAIAKLADETSISRDIFITPNGLQATSDIAYAKAIEAVLKSQKKVLILKLPETDQDGKLKMNKKFALPLPYYDKGSLMTKNQSINPDYDNRNFVTFNPNFSPEEKSEANMIKKMNNNVVPNKEEYKKFLKILKALKKLSHSEDFSSEENLNAFINQYAKNIFVPNKEVIFDVLNGQKNLASSNDNGNWTTKGSYEYLDNSWTQEASIIYEIKEKTGQVKHFLNRKDAIIDLRDKEYTLKRVKVGRETIKYNFENMLFDSIEEIYNYILNNQGDKNEKK